MRGRRTRSHCSIPQGHFSGVDAFWHKAWIHALSCALQWWRVTQCIYSNTVFKDCNYWLFSLLINLLIIFSIYQLINDWNEIVKNVYHESPRWYLQIAYFLWETAQNPKALNLQWYKPEKSRKSLLEKWKKKWNDYQNSCQLFFLYNVEVFVRLLTILCHFIFFAAQHLFDIYTRLNIKTYIHLIKYDTIF